MNKVKIQLIENAMIFGCFIIAAFIFGNDLLQKNSYEAGEVRYILDTEGNIISSHPSTTPLNTESYPNIGYTYENNWGESSGLYRVQSGSYDINTDEESGSLDYLSKAEYIHSFWDDFCYPSTKNYAIYKMIDGIINGFPRTNSVELGNNSFYMDDGNLFLYDIKSGNYGVADLRGNWLLSPEYQKIDTSHTDKGIVIVENDKGYQRRIGVTDLDYNVLIEPKYEFIDFCNDYIFVSNYENYIRYFALYDYNGNAIIGPDYGDIVFYDSFMKVEIDNTDDMNLSDYVDEKDRYYGIYDYEGNAILEPIYRSITIGEGTDTLIVEDQNSQYRLLDFEGNDILGDYYKYIECINQGEGNEHQYVFIIEDQDEHYYFCDKDGKKLSDEIFDYVKDIFGSDDLYIAGRDDKYGLIDCLGNIRLEFKYSELDDLHEDSAYMVANLDGKAGVIDVSGTTIIDFNYKSILSYNYATNKMGDKYIVITEDDRIGVVNTQNEIFIEPESYSLFDGEYKYTSDDEILYFQFDDQKWVILKPDSLPVEFHFGELKYLGGGLFLGRNYSGYSEVKGFVIDSSGNIVWEFDEFSYDVEATMVEGKPLLVIAAKDRLTIMYDGNIVAEENYAIDFIEIKDNNLIAVCPTDSSGYRIYNYKGDYLGIDCNIGTSTEIKGYYDESSGLYGLRDKFGNIVLDFEYEYVEVSKYINYHNVKEGGMMAVVKTNGKYGIVDVNGNWIYEPQFDWASVSNGVIQVTLREGQEIKK
ncbi:WG repeat-containing protein [Butyrivibrio proteoclasticus]|uniref:WG repeat-containing protein n=1 Tax=Butyrivibrio proteoclasticus TaxID=43305 RepID=UPI00047E0FFD|nr:WG repeat-containing protein [Butyrivibrio proteoclasticus]